MLGGITKTDAPTPPEIMPEEIVQLIEQLLPETLFTCATSSGKRLTGGINIFHQLRKDTVLEVTGFDSHQIDVARFAFHFGADEVRFQCFQELLLVGHALLPLKDG